MIAQAGDAAQLADKGDNPFSGSQNTSFSDQANLETPNAKPEHVDSKESPQKSSSGKLALYCTWQSGNKSGMPCRCHLQT